MVLAGEVEEVPEAVVPEVVVEAEVDSAEAGAEELPALLVAALELRVPPNAAFGPTLLSVFEAAFLNESSVSEPWLMTPTMPPWQCESMTQ